MTIEEVLNKRIEEERVERKKRERSGKINPSSLGQCYRRQYWNRMNEPETDPIDMEVLKRFKLGTIIEEYVLKLLPDDVKKKVRFETEDISGEIDIEWEDYIEDLKSLDGFQWTYVKKYDEKDVWEKKTEYVYQVMTYVVLKGKKFGRITFVEKNGMQTRSVDFKKEDYESFVIDELKMVRGYWERKELPAANPRLYKDKDGKSKECQYCQFATKCSGKPF